MKIKKMLAAIAVTAIAATAFALPMSAATYRNTLTASATINTDEVYSRLDSSKTFESSDMSYLGTLSNGDKVYRTADGQIIAVHIERKG